MNPSDYYSEETTYNLVCSCCGERLTHEEDADPIILKKQVTVFGSEINLEKVFCYSCADEISYLRQRGDLKPVSSITKEVVESHNRKLEADLAEMIYPINSVRHI